MKIGFIFPGQGAQSIGMGKELYDQYEEFQKVYHIANEILGISLEKITFYGDEENLSQTDHTQIAIFVMCMGILKILEKYDIKAEMVTGLSLGEYAALQYAGAFSLQQGIEIVAKRGELMKKFVPKGEWAMAAVIGISDAEVEDACNQVTEGFVKAVNYNCPGQVAISGEKMAVEKAMQIAKEKGSKKVVELKTKGPFHTELLREAAFLLKEELEKHSFQEIHCQVVKNLDGQIYKKEEQLSEVLFQHMISPVRFCQGIQTMLENGIDTFIEIGPGKVLSGFVKKTAKQLEKEVQIFHIESEENLQEVIQYCTGNLI